MTAPFTPSLLVIGSGGIGERHLRCFRETGRAVMSACEPKESLRTAIASNYGVPVYASISEALQAGTFDGAVICTPASTHIEIARQCVEAGLHVLIEKPLSVTFDGLSAFQDLLKERTRIVRVAYVYRSIPAVRMAREFVMSGAVGAIHHVVVSIGQNFPSFRPDYREIYYAHRASGGGVIQDALTHAFNAVEWTVGPVVDVACLSAHRVLPGVEVEDIANVICRHENSALSSFSINQFQPATEVVISYHGERGSVRADIVRQAVGTQAIGEPDWTWREAMHGGRDGPFLLQANSFLDAMEGKPDDLCSLEEAIQTLRLNRAAMESGDTNAFIRLGG